MQKQKQLGFAILEAKSVKHFGGAYLKNSHAKTKRPITTKQAMHLVLRSSLAMGHRSFLRFSKPIEKILRQQSRIHGVKIYRWANGGNHLHLIVLPHSREAFKDFVRSVSGLIARLVTGIERGPARIRDIKYIRRLQFWDKRHFTRIIQWGREYRAVCKYLLQNTLEALGFVPYTPRKQRFIAASRGRARMSSA